MSNGEAGVFPIFSPYYSELGEYGESDEESVPVQPPTFLTHSDSCFVCNRFRQFLRRQQEMLPSQVVRVPSNENDLFLLDTENLVFPDQED